jgi:NAD(P)-dependent dehydrogenase (short-subunit alcohol dehydrogenase family)
VIGRSLGSVGDARKEIGANGIAIAADVTKSADLDSLFKQVRDKYGQVDILYVNAGIAKLGSVAETTEEVFDEIVDANFRGAYFTVQKALPLMSDGGAIVFTTSWFDEAGIAGTSAVSASKAALRNLTRTLASELIGRNIRVNAVSPGVIETPLFGKLGLSEADARTLARPCCSRFRSSGSASRKKLPQRWPSLPPITPLTSRASNSLSTADALSCNRPHQRGHIS